MTFLAVVFDLQITLESFCSTLSKTQLSSIKKYNLATRNISVRGQNTYSEEVGERSKDHTAELFLEKKDKVIGGKEFFKSGTGTSR